MKKTTQILLLSVGIMFSCSTLNVTKIDPAQKTTSKRNGVFYNLPKIEYDVLLTYEKIDISPSDLYTADPKAFADAISGIDGQFEYYKDEKTSFKLKDIVITPRSIPDPDNTYFVEFRRQNALFLKKKYSFEFNSGMFVTDATNNSEDNTVTAAVTTVNTAIKTLTSIYSPLSKAGLTGAPLPSDKIKDIILRIREIRKSKTDILAGKMTGLNYQNAPIQYLLNRLDEEEKSLLDLLKGDKEVTTLKQSFSYFPAEGETILFYFSGDKGPNEVKEGDQITFNLDKNEIKKITDDFFLLKGSQVKDKNKGLFYRIPFNGLLTIRKAKTELMRTNIAAPQLGSIGFLPAKVAARLNELSYKLDGKTGALVKFEANGEGLKIEDFKSLYETVEGLPEKLKKPEKAAENEYEVIEKEIKQLEYDLKKKLLEAKLDSIANATK